MPRSGQRTSPVEITPQLLLRAYSVGVFPMAESADDPTLFWVDPPERGIFPLDGMRISSRLARTLRSDRFTVVADRDFPGVIAGCAAAAPDRPNTWINWRIRDLYQRLFDMGSVHTVEAYDESGELAGGLYGVSLGAAFFGESMFHRATDASKVALLHLVARLRLGGYRLLDTQFVTPHLESLGAVEIGRADYHAQLRQACESEARFENWPAAEPMAGARVLEILKPRQ